MINFRKFCEVCDAEMKKRNSESWQSFSRRPTCSPSCGAILRQRRAHVTAKELVNAMNLWRVPPHIEKRDRLLIV